MENWKKTFAVIWSGQLASILSSSVVAFAIIFWVSLETGSAQVLALAAIAGMLPQSLLGPLVGVYVDRWDRKWTMILADSFIALCTLLLAVLFWLGVARMWHIYVLLACRSIGSAFHTPAMQASVPLLAPKQQLTRIAGINQIISSLSNIIGPAFGALLINLTGIGNILLLDIYNTLGLPTSTTVSMVFGLLGAGVAAALYHIWGDPAASVSDLSQYINTGKAMAIIAAILLSVALAFAAGSLFMYVSRLIFSFRYAKAFRRWGAVWCGISLAGILYFALFKGLKSSGLIPTSVGEYVGEHVLVTLLVFWAGASVVLWIFQRMRLNIMRITILTGTFALALAFAGNDLVNFIGVPLASYDAWQIARETGSESIMMGELANPARANFLLLLLSGAVMVLTLFFSKKSRHVTETELSLASQHEGDERFGSTFVSRSLVRASLALNTMWTGLIPDRMQKVIDRRFEPLPAEERSSAPYDMIRAVVNLTAASILIAIGTSYKLPLSTTYVVFMVAMGSSLADRTWGRESAVYRITGVMAVISGWFITALGGFLIALCVTLLLLWGGWIAVTALVALCAWLLIRSHRTKPEEKAAAEELPVIKAETPDEVLCVCIGEVCTTMEQVTRIYNRTLVAVFKENRKVLKEMVQSSNRLFEEARDRKYGIMPTLRRLQQCDIDTGHFYVQVVDYLSEVTKALIHIYISPDDNPAEAIAFLREYSTPVSSKMESP